MKRMSTGTGGDGYEMVGGQITPRGAVWLGGQPVHDGNARMRYSLSNPWLVNFRVLLFSVTVRTMTISRRLLYVEMDAEGGIIQPQYAGVTVARLQGG